MNDVRRGSVKEGGEEGGQRYRFNSELRVEDERTFSTQCPPESKILQNLASEIPQSASITLCSSQIEQGFELGAKDSQPSARKF